MNPIPDRNQDQDRNGWFLGVDGGGTSTTAWVGQMATGTRPIVLGRAVRGPSNLRSVDWITAREHLNGAIVAACRNAGIEPDRLDGICLGIAGASGETEQRRLRTWYQQKWGNASSIHTANDLELVFASVEQQLGDRDEPPPLVIAIIAGTGAVVGGRYDGQLRIQGGWGFLLDDIGSGYWLGKQAIEATLRALDDQASNPDNHPMTELPRRVLEHLEAGTRTEILDWLYSDRSPQQRVAELAPLVFACSPTDAIAKHAIERGAESLRIKADSIRLELGPPQRPCVFALAGSLLTHQSEYRRLILERLAGKQNASDEKPSAQHFDNPLPHSVSIIEHPVEGALYLAAKRL